MAISMTRTGICSVFVLAAACSGFSDQGNEPASEQVVQAYESVYKLYLRCNATSWELNTTSQLQPTADPYLFTLDYQVKEPWMVTTRDTCWVTDATSGYNDYGTSSTSTLSVPSLGQAATRLAFRANMLAIKYPSLGFYRATVNWRDGNIAIQRVVNQTYLYMRLRFADDEVGYTPQSDESILSEVEDIRQKYYRWSNGHLSITATVTPTLDLPYTHDHYVTAPCNEEGYPDWTGMYWLIDDALAAAGNLGYNGAAYNVHSVRYDGEPGCCCHWGGGTETWVRADGFEAHEWGHNLGMPNEGAFRSRTSNPLNPDREYEDSNLFSGMHNTDTNAFYSVPDLRDIGILGDSSVIRPTVTGTYRIYTHSVEPVGLNPARKYAIELTDGGQPLTFEYRHVVPSNVDPVCTNGLLIFDSDDNELVDATPRSKTTSPLDDETDAALPLYRTLTSWDGKWTIRALAKGGSGNSSYMDVRVTFTGR